MAGRYEDAFWIAEDPGPLPILDADTQTIFADGFHGFQMNNAVVRLNLIENIYPPDPETGAHRRVVARLAMGLSGLLMMHEALTPIIKQLEETGMFFEGTPDMKIRPNPE